MTYKKDQGRYARLAAFWSCAILGFYGCTSLYDQLASFESLKRPLSASMPKIPVLGLAFNPAMLITAAVLGLGLWLLIRWHDSPKVADLLIETESEMRKVTWPTFSEAMNSSMIVILCVAFLMAFLYGADMLLGWWASRILMTGGG
jgi:preprotein translocase SecE subunit